MKEHTLCSAIFLNQPIYLFGYKEFFGFNLIKLKILKI